MDIDTSALFAPIVINSHTVKNRLSVAPMFVRGRRSSRPLRRPRFRMINGSEL
jgi:2,4-dienoyl-CoA reductase-like NADH-dependent reductase (Old Yellow Enzyme family)